MSRMFVEILIIMKFVLHSTSSVATLARGRARGAAAPGATFRGRQIDITKKEKNN